MDVVGDGWLRLTAAESNQRGVAYFDVPIPTDEGLIIDFEYASWGGIGADGLTAFLFDGAIGGEGAAAFQIGGWGGSLGYAQRCTSAGMAGGYVGIGFDEYGNYSNYRECRQGGSSGDLVPDAIGVRGSAQSAYAYLTGTMGGVRELDCPRWQCASRPGPGEPGRHGVRIAIVPSGDSYAISVFLQADDGLSYEEIIPPYTLPDLPPPTLKFGYAASTGNSHNIHEIRNLTIAAPTDLGVSIIDLPETAFSGDEVIVELSLENLGSQRASATLMQNAGAWMANASIACQPLEACGEGDVDELAVTLEGNAAAIVTITGTVQVDPSVQPYSATLLSRGYEVDTSNNSAGGEVEILTPPTPPMEEEAADMGEEMNADADMEPVIDDGEDDMGFTVIDLTPKTDMGSVIEDVDMGAPETDMEDPGATDSLEYSYGGQGCSATSDRSPASPWLLLLAGFILFAATRRRGARALKASALAGVSGIAFVFTPQVSLAQNVAYPQTSVENFEPLPNQGSNVLGAASTRQHPHLGYEVGVMMHYVARPLVLGVKGEAPTVALISGQLKPEVFASLGLFDRAEVGVGIPYIAYQRGEVMRVDGTPGERVGSAHLGDIRATLRWRLLDAEKHAGFGLGAMGTVSAPTGDPAQMTSDGSARVEGRIVADWQNWRGWRVGANLGYQTRREVSELDAYFGDQLVGMVYGDVGIFSMWRLRGVLSSRMVTSAVIPRIVDKEPVAAPSEVTLALARPLGARLGLQLFGGWGIGQAPGAPAWRAGAGITYRPAPRVPEVACAYPVEDFDGYLDDDGCLDPDNDADGVADIDDLCPNEEGLEKHEGCPAPAPAPESAVATIDTRVVEEVSEEAPTRCEPPAAEVAEVPEEAEVATTAQPETFEVDGDRLILEERIYFATDRDTIEPRSWAMLEEVAAWMLAHPDRGRLIVEGYASTPGSEAHNLDLSRRRALAVAMFLVKRGVPPERLMVYAYGEERSSFDKKELLGHQLEQRVELRLAQPSVVSSSSTSP